MTFENTNTGIDGKNVDEETAAKIEKLVKNEWITPTQNNKQIRLV